jgi:hypothetical protein
MRPKAIRCWSKGGPQNTVWNWGDAINPLLFQYVAGIAPEIIDFTDQTDTAHLIICGSTLKWATRGSILWGTGEIAEKMDFLQPGVRPLGVAAVRGPLTRKRLMDADISCPEIYCDPAFIFPNHYIPAPVPRRYRLGLIPHYIDQGLPALDAFRQDDSIRIIDITQSGVPQDRRIHRFIDEVCSCDAILSSSLHGLILADAYGIPSKWMRLSGKVFGGGFKFSDYFLGVDQPQRAQQPLTRLDSIEAMSDAAMRDFARYGRARPDTAAFLAAFPGRTQNMAPTDLKRWAKVAVSLPPWDRRNQMIARHIPEDSNVMDFGAGNQTLRRHLNLQSYLPIDCVKNTRDVFLCDYNKECRFPQARPDVIVMSGFLEYIVETEDFLAALQRAYPNTRCLFSWAFEPRSAPERLHNGWISKLNPASQQEAPFAKYFDALRVLDEHVTPHTRQLIYEGVL